jgi:ribosomal protein S30
MADKDNIDKALPNVDQEVVLPKEEIVVTEEDKLSEVDPEGAEVIMDEEGGAEINFDPMSEQQVTRDHFANIAELLPDDVLGSIGSELNENYMQYKTSRKDWEDTYIKGLDLLGFKYVNPTQPFQGASGATHPVLAEAVTQFQAQAYKELLPAMGPVRTQTLGRPSRQKEEQSIRVKNFMNYQLMDVMKEYEPEFDLISRCGGGYSRYQNVRK